MTERHIFRKDDNLSEDELSKKSKENVYVKNDVVSIVLKRCRGDRKIDGFKKRLMIPESEILESPKHKVKSKIEKIFVNEKILEEYSVKIYASNPYFKYKLIKMGVNIYYLELMFILLNIS